MNELELMQHAKNYLDKLAQGVNPLTGEPVAPGDVVNQVRISRCLHYVSEVLGQVIENGGVKPRRQSRVRPFSIAPDALGRFAYADQPILVSHIAKRVNELVDSEEQRTLSGAVILNWLESVGLVEQVRTAEGTRSRRPTAQGHAIGISVQQRNGPSGPYEAVVYDRRAQEFIIAHMQDIAALTRRQDRPSEGVPEPSQRG